MTESKVPDIIIGRMPMYLRALTRMAEEGKTITSSQELGTRLGLSSAQIRKDLSQFGEFGKQGTGYNIDFLAEQIRRILKVDGLWEVALIGIGHLGTAIANYGGFVDRGFQVAALFDNQPDIIGKQIGRLTVQPMQTMVEEIRHKKIRIAMITVPAKVAQQVADACIEAGVRSILCFAPTSITTPKGVRVEYSDPVLHLQRMTYYLQS